MGEAIVTKYDEARIGIKAKLVFSLQDALPLEES
jgi:hypothetical protein